MEHSEQGLLVASQEELEAFQRLPESERQLTEPLRGLLAEVANTGIVRYPWHLLRPLLMHLMERVLQEFDATSSVEVGPPMPLPHDENVDALYSRFKRCLWDFSGAPWTIQRLCELLLEPRKQYSQLHKLALALDKLLMVTSEVGTERQPPPRPSLSTIRPVNENPPRPQPSAAGGSKGVLSGMKRAREDEEGMGLITASLDISPLNGYLSHATGDGSTSQPAAAAHAGTDAGAPSAGSSGSDDAQPGSAPVASTNAAAAPAEPAAAGEQEPSPMVLGGGDAAASSSHPLADAEQPAGEHSPAGSGPGGGGAAGEAAAGSSPGGQPPPADTAMTEVQLRAAEPAGVAVAQGSGD